MLGIEMVGPGGVRYQFFGRYADVYIQLCQKTYMHREEKFNIASYKMSLSPPTLQILGLLYTI